MSRRRLRDEINDPPSGRDEAFAKQWFWLAFVLAMIAIGGCLALGWHGGRSSEYADVLFWSTVVLWAVGMITLAAFGRGAEAQAVLIGGLAGVLVSPGSCLVFLLLA